MLGWGNRRQVDPGGEEHGAATHLEPIGNARPFEPSVRSAAAGRRAASARTLRRSGHATRASSRIRFDVIAPSGALGGAKMVFPGRSQAVTSPLPSRNRLFSLSARPARNTITVPVNGSIFGADRTRAANPS